jgi:dUTP pyrophosphatase
MKETETLSIRKMTPNAKIPKYATAGSAGMDLHCVEDFNLPAMTRMLIPTGLQMAIPRGYEGQIRPRSSLALKYGVTVLNTPGTIDSDYRGEVKILLANLSDEDAAFSAGDRIAQIVFAKVMRVDGAQVDELPPTERGEGGFGSTGR